MGRFFRWLLRMFIYLFLFSNIYLLLCKWMDPPITATQMGSLLHGDGLKRDYINYAEMAPAAKLAAIASEDQLFPEHGGFDWKQLEKSMEAHGKRPRGAAASTISQQVAKNVFLWQGSGIMRYVRKVPEVYFTKMIEWVWGKQRILEVYLNVAEMGRGIFGIEAAAQAYFKKNASKLTRAEAAMIISGLPSPKRYTVKPMSRWVSWRHKGVLRQMRLIEPMPGVQHLVYGKKKKGSTLKQ